MNDFRTTEAGGSCDVFCKYPYVGTPGEVPRYDVTFATPGRSWLWPVLTGYVCCKYVIICMCTYRSVAIYIYYMICIPGPSEWRGMGFGCLILIGLLFGTPSRVQVAKGCVLDKPLRLLVYYTRFLNSVCRLNHDNPCILYWYVMFPLFVPYLTYLDFIQWIIL
jgi:hypothetical protein